ncbi:MAG TPA: YHS domain-containing protein [Candidatus Veblenbacteria bacterium]|nr:YHS domain-containing protein [Candidatus Veblenbacteria bacterium]
MFNIDPVCKKKLRRKEAYGIVKYGGTAYHLCCKACQEEFVRNPLPHIPDGAPGTPRITPRSGYN